MTDAGRLAVLKRYAERYGEIWQDIERGMNEPEDAFFLMGPANYFFTTGGVKWAVDPMFNVPRTRESAALINSDGVMRSLSFVLLTHRHADHFDKELMKQYPDADWIVPDHLMNEIPEELHPKMTVARPGDVITRGEITIRAFKSLHFDAGTTLGVQETGYFVEAGKHRMLFPGDVRDYDAAQYPSFENVTHLFLHVWLGRGNALNWPCGEYPGQMARFAQAFAPKKIMLAHLLEATRPLKDMWTYAHAGLVMDEITALNPAADVCAPMVGKKYRLE